MLEPINKISTHITQNIHIKDLSIREYNLYIYLLKKCGNERLFTPIKTLHIAKALHITYKECRNDIKKLTNKGIIETKTIWLPPKNGKFKQIKMFRINL